MIMLFENVLAAIFNSLGLDESNYRLINADVLPVDQLGVTILKTRINETEKYKKLIFYGFDPYEILLEKETYNPRLLVSPGVYYLQLPANIADVERIASSRGIDKQKDVYESLKNYMFTGSQMSRMESLFSHKYGNLFGPENFLYGAYLAGIFDYETFEKVLADIDSIIDTYYSDIKNTPEYISYKFNCKYAEKNDKKKCDNRKLLGSYLIIDDQSHLGWTQALVSSFDCTDKHKNSTFKDTLFIDNWKNEDESLSFVFISNLKFSEGKYEDQFILELKEFLQKSFIDLFDVIIMDYRLRSLKDENTEDVSGVDILKYIRTKSRSIPIIVFSASNKTDTLLKINKYGADSFYSKKSTFKNNINEVSKYYSNFNLLLLEMYEKKYLKNVCNIIDNNNPKNISQKSEIEYYLNKSVELLRFYKSNDYFKEAITNIAILRESCGEKIINIKNSFDGGFFIKRFRNELLHGTFYQFNDDDYDGHEDAKISLYTAIRLFYSACDEELLLMSRSMFGEKWPVDDMILNSSSFFKDKINEAYNDNLNKSFHFYLNKSTKSKTYTDIVSKEIKPITIYTSNASIEYLNGGSINKRQAFILCALMLLSGLKLFNPSKKSDIHLMMNIADGLIGKNNCSFCDDFMGGGNGTTA